jgi:phosphopantetheine--protein transferase-like protein
MNTSRKIKTLLKNNSEVLGVGVDIVDVNRIRNIKEFERFLSFYFIDSEIKEAKEAKDVVEWAASRIAAKEAVIKAFPGKLYYHNFIIAKSGKKPIVKFTKLSNKNKEYKAFVSLSHEFKHAIAYAIIALNKHGSNRLHKNISGQEKNKRRGV